MGRHRIIRWIVEFERCVAYFKEIKILISSGQVCVYFRVRNSPQFLTFVQYKASMALLNSPTTMTLKSKLIRAAAQLSSIHGFYFWNTPHDSKFEGGVFFKLPSRCPGRGHDV